MPELAKNDESIFAVVVEMSPDERAAYLDNICGADAALRGRIEGLLHSHDNAGSFLNDQRLGMGVTADCGPLTEAAGTIIGRYKLLQPIGEGGFGVVYMAEQKEPVRRKVALKIIKLGMDSKEVIARFEAERQALALMDHPNIAKVLDAGTTESGRPYFVMELVKGVPVGEFCDKNQMPARERLELFTAVCQAVQHAHQKGIIHRDIKPSNVLVTLHDGRPVPKVIDFGVAKALNQQLTEKTLFTAFGHMVGTPQYMSPEQAEMSGLDLDTRSDVYSLGVLLYELLTGTTPLEGQMLRKAGYAEMQRLIREEESPRPSVRVSTLGERLSVVAKDRQCDPKHLQQLLRGELDWIVMKSLEKDRTRRYETASAFAADVRRHMNDELVEARPPSAWYRVRKLARRNKAAVTTAALVAAALVLGIIGTSLGLVQAMDAEAKAVAARDEEARRRREVEDQRKLAVAATADARKSEELARDSEKRAIASEKAGFAVQEELRAALYVSRWSVINTAWTENNIPRVRELLDELRPKPRGQDLRGFEWHYLDRLCRLPELGKLPKNDPKQGAKPIVTSDALQALLQKSKIDPKQLDSLLNKKSKNEPKQVAEPPSFHVVLSRDGNRQVVYYPSTAKLPGRTELDVRDAAGKEIQSFKEHKSPIRYAWISPNGRYIVSEDTSNEAMVWDAATGKVCLTQRWVGENTGGIGEPSFSLDGCRLALQIPGGGVKVWHLDPFREIFASDAMNTGPKISPDGRSLVTTEKLQTKAGDFNTKLHWLWNVETGKALTSWPGSLFSSEEPEFSRDGRWLAAHPNPFPTLKTLSSPKTAPAITVFDTATGEAVVTFNEGIEAASYLASFSLAFSPDGTRLAAAVDNKNENQRDFVVIWEISPGKRLLHSFLSFNVNKARSRPNAPSHSLAFAPDGKRLAAAAVHLFDPSSKLKNLNLQKETILAVKLFDASTGTLMLDLEKTAEGGRGSSNIILSGNSGRLSFSPDGHKLILETPLTSPARSWPAVIVWDATPQGEP